MDAVKYLKTYERMKEAEGLLPWESPFDSKATEEEKVALIEEWDRENPAIAKNVYELKLGEELEMRADKNMRDLMNMRELIAELHLQIIELQIRVEELECIVEEELL